MGTRYCHDQKVNATFNVGRILPDSCGMEDIKYGLSNELGYNLALDQNEDELVYKLGVGLPLLKPTYPVRQINLFFETKTSWFTQLNGFQALYAQEIQFAKGRWRIKSAYPLPDSSIDLGEGKPIGLTILTNNLYLSDGNQQQLQVVNLNSGQIKTVKGFDRPMHLDSDEAAVWVPEYTASHIRSYCAGSIDSILNEIDTPASIGKKENKYAIAEFYRNEITYFNGTKTLKISKKGHANGEFNYPTDVQLFINQIYVADAYNHRGQVLDTAGNWLKTLAYNQGINTAAGIYICQEATYVTDFENSRVLILDHQGQLLQAIGSGLHKPTDVLVHHNRLYITNFEGNNVSVFKRE